MNMRSLTTAGAASILAALLFCSSARAQAAQEEKSITASVVEGLDDAWTTVKSYVVPGSGTGLVSRQLMANTQSSALDFKSMMDAAGYKVKEIETGIGLVPYLSFSFGQAREPAENDVAYVNRLLRKHERAFSSPVAYAESAIVRAVLDVQEIRGYTLEKVNVDFLPLPSVKFYAVPVDAPLSEEGSRIMEAIDRLNITLAKQQGR
jgi:hypothetical protein